MYFAILQISCQKLLGGVKVYRRNTGENLFRVTDIRFSKCSGIGLLYLTQTRDRQNLPLADFAGHFGAFAIHGSGLALGNVLLPSCWIVYRTLRKANILHSHKFSPVFLRYTLAALWVYFGNLILRCG